MMLTLDKQGRLSIDTFAGSVPVTVNSLEDIHRIIELYEIDFISPVMNEAHKHTSDQKLLSILDEFQLQRAYVLLATTMFRNLPKA